MNKEKKFNVEEHSTLDGRIIDVFPISHRYIHDLEQQCRKQKEAIDKIKHILNNQINYREFVDIVNDIEDLLKEVSE